MTPPFDLELRNCSSHPSYKHFQVQRPAPTNPDTLIKLFGQFIIIIIIKIIFIEGINFIFCPTHYHFCLLEVHLQPLALECFLPFPKLLPQSLHRLACQSQVVHIQHLTHQTISLDFAPSYKLITALTIASGIPLFLIAHYQYPLWDPVKCLL